MKSTISTISNFSLIGLAGLFVHCLKVESNASSNFWALDEDVARKISNASCQCATELRSEGSWLNKVALPLLDGAIAELPLECWSMYVLTTKTPCALLLCC